MKLKATLITLALMGLSAAASAAPSLQACSQMEVSHNGTNGLSYVMACEAGGWKMNYSGSIPAGTGEVLAKYRLSVTGERGESFTSSRQVRLPEPSMLGQVLLREAVLLDSGDLALRACDPIGCTQYRPLGATKSGLTEATITGAQEILRLKREVLRLDDLATSRGDNLAKAQAELNERQAAVVKLQNELTQVSDKLASVEQHAAAERADMTAQLATANSARDEAQRAVAAAVAAAAEAKSATVAAQDAAAHLAKKPAPAPEIVEVQVLPPERELAAILGLDEQLARKYQSLKLEHEDTLAKLERAQNEASLASARLETLKLTQSLTAQNLSIAHAELDSAKYELAQVKNAAAAQAAPTPVEAPPVAACSAPAAVKDAVPTSKVEPAKSGDAKDALIGRVTEALVNSNAQNEALKAEIERLKRPGTKTVRK